MNVRFFGWEQPLASGSSRPEAAGQGGHPIRIVEVQSALAEWLLPGEQIAGWITLMRTQSAARQPHVSQQQLVPVIYKRILIFPYANT